MAPISANSWISFFVIGFYIIAALFIIAYIVVKGKRNAENVKEDKEHYDKMYETIQRKILNKEVYLSKCTPSNAKYNAEHYEVFIRDLIEILENLHYKNEEKTRVLWDNFNKEFNR
jgi:hypothetical protein